MAICGVLRNSIKGIVVLAFCAAGILKITDKIAPDVHKELKNNFVELAKVHPMKLWFGHNVNAELNRVVIGCTQVICALLLYGGAKAVKIASTAALLVIEGVTLQGLYLLGKPTIMFVPAAFGTMVLLVYFGFLLTERSQKEKKR